MWSRVITLVIGLLPTANTAAIDMQDHQSIHRVASAFLEDMLVDVADKEISINPIDRRLLLKPCTTDLEAFMPAGGTIGNRTTIGVRCTGENSWKVYLTASIRMFKQIAVASKHISRGKRIADDDIRYEQQEVSALTRGYFTDNEMLIGKIAKNTIINNTVIDPSLLTEPKLVKRGNSVTIIATHGPVSVSMHGKAMSDGRLGETIRIRNMTSQKIVHALVTGPNLAKTSNSVSY